MRPKNRREYIAKCDRRPYRMARINLQIDRDICTDCFVPTIQQSLSPEAHAGLLRIRAEHGRPARPAKAKRVEQVSWSGHYRGRKPLKAGKVPK